MTDFFISYTSADKNWAVWIAAQLERLGYKVLIQEWTFKDGPAVVHQINDALDNTHTTIAVLSPNYLQSNWCRLEWQTAMDMEVKQDGHRLLFFRVRNCELPSVIGARARTELIGLTENEAVDRIAKAVSVTDAPTSEQVSYPGTFVSPPDKSARFPGTLSDIWWLQYDRNPNFTGRDDLLDKLRETLTTEHLAAVTQVVAGHGGVGKTQLAVEYAYRHAVDYDCVWWVRAELEETRNSDLAALAHPLNLKEKDMADQSIVVTAVLKWLGENRSWLLILDNIPHPEDLSGFAPQGGQGHVIITSRDPNWSGVGNVLGVEVFDRQTSTEFLLKHTNLKSQLGSINDTSNPSLEFGGSPEEKSAADELAKELGDLPLALAQAVGYIEQTQIMLPEYLVLFRQRRLDLWQDESAPQGHEQDVGTTFDLAIKQLLPENPTDAQKTAADLLNLCAFLAPDNIPRWLMSECAKCLPAPSATVAADKLQLNKALAELRSYGLIELTPETISLHRLMQVVLRDRIDKSYGPLKTSKSTTQQLWANIAVRLIFLAFPQSGTDPRVWSRCGLLLPHALVSVEHAEKLGTERKMAALLLNAIGVYLWSRFELSHAKNIHQRAIALDEAQFGSCHLAVANGLNNLGLVLWDLVDIEGARAVHERALEVREVCLGHDHPVVAASLNNLGVVLWDSADNESASLVHKRALVIFKKRLGDSHLAVAASLTNLGSVVNDMGGQAIAATAYEKALSILDSVMEPDGFWRLSGKEKIIDEDLGELAIARAVLDPLIAAERALGLVERESVPASCSVVDTGLTEDASAKVCATFKRVMSNENRSPGEHHYAMRAIILDNFGVVLARLGLLSEAKVAFQHALAIREDRLGQHHPDVGWSLTNLGVLESEFGRHSAGRALLEQGLAIREAALGADHPDVATNLSALSTVLARLSEYEAAQKACELALDIRTSRLGSNHPVTKTTRKNLATILNLRQ